MFNNYYSIVSIYTYNYIFMLLIVINHTMSCTDRHVCTHANLSIILHNIVWMETILSLIGDCLHVCWEPHLYVFGDVGVEPSIATRLTVNGQEGPQVNGVTPGCCWVKSPHAAVGAPTENAETSLTWDAIWRTRRNEQATSFIMHARCWFVAAICVNGLLNGKY